MQPPNQKTPLFDVKLCYPFIEAVCEVLSQQCHLNAQMGPVGFKEHSTEATDVAITGTLSTSASIASISICFPKAVMLGAIGKMLGETFTELNPEVEDAAMELANLIFNQAKGRLAKKGIQAVRSIPMIVLGMGTRLRYLSRQRTMILPVNTDIGKVIIEVTTQELTVSDTI